MNFCKRVNLGLILLIAVFFGMYGFATQQSAVAEVASGAFPTGDKSSSVIYIEKDLPSESLVGQSIDFIINVTNLTDSAVKNVEVSETLASNFDVSGSDPAMNGDVSSGRVSWSLGDLGPRETKVIRVTGSPTSTGSLEFCCTDVAFKLPPICMATSVVQPALRIAKQAPSEVMICDTIPITLVVTNTGTGTAQNVVVSDSLPSGLSTLDGKSHVEYEVGPLQSGESREISIEAKAESAGSFSNSATAVAGGGLSEDSNTTTTVVTKPILRVTKTCPDTRYIGRNITCKIVVTNEGDAPAAETIVDDCLPDNTTFVNASDGGQLVAEGRAVMWNLGTLQPRESREVTLTVRADSIGESENCVAVNAVCADGVKDCAITNVRGIPAVLLEVIDIEDPIEVGSSETYVVTVTNQGTAPGTNISIVCDLEDTMQYISSTGATSGYESGNTVTFTPLASLASKAKAEWRINVKAVNSGDVRFKVTLTSDQLERVVEETESTHFYQ